MTNILYGIYIAYSHNLHISIKGLMQRQPDLLIWMFNDYILK